MKKGKEKLYRSLYLYGKKPNAHQYGQARQQRRSYSGNGLQKGLQRQQQLCDQLIFQESYLKFMAHLTSS